MSENTETVVYYIDNISEGCIEVVFSINEGTVTVKYIESQIPGREYGIHLMLHACKEALKQGISTIVLDDCSSRHRTMHNMYTKIGMLYDDISGPEMSGQTDVISQYNTKSLTPIILRYNSSESCTFSDKITL